MKTNTRKLKRRRWNSGKDSFYNSLNRSEQNEVLENIILTLKPGSYLMIGDYGNLLKDHVMPKFRVDAFFDIDQKLIRGLAVRYPDKVGICFTHGLQQFTVTKKRKYEDIFR